jgi:hypothetical protein
MLTFKLGVLTCAFYVVLTAGLELGVWAWAHSKGFSIFFDRRHSFWTMGLRLGFIFGALWVIAFSAAWLIVYHGLKAKFASILN